MAATMSALLGTVGMMPFHPMVDGDVLTAPPGRRARRAARPPVSRSIAGTTADEMRLFVDSSTRPRRRENGRAARAARYLGARRGRRGAVVDALRAPRSAPTTPTRSGARCSATTRCRCPCRAVLDAHAPHGPTYTYCFTWGGPRSARATASTSRSPFGNFVDGWDAFVGLDDDGRALSTSMRDAWAAFARTGDPGWTSAPATMILGELSDVAPVHPFFARLPRPDHRG